MIRLERMDLKQLRENAELGPEEAAFKLGISLSTLRNWEAGKHQPTMSPDQFVKTLSVYCCSIDVFRQAVNNSLSNYQNKQ